MLARPLRTAARRCLSTAAAEKAPIVMFGTSGRYANAIYAAGAKKGELDAVTADLALFKETLHTSPVLTNFCIDPSLSREAKAKSVIALLASANACDTTKNALASLAEGGRMGDVEKVISMYQEIVAAASGEMKAIVTSAKPLSDAELSEIKQALIKSTQDPSGYGGSTGSATMTIETKVNPELVSGITVEMGDKFIDASVATQLKKLTVLLHDGM